MAKRDERKNVGQGRALLILGLVLILLGGVLRVIDPLPVRGLRVEYFDYLQKLSPREPADLPVRVIDIDEQSLAEIGQWPWPRTLFVQLLDRLAELGVAVVAFDILFAEPDRLSPANLAREPALADFFTDTADLQDLDNDKRLAAAIEGRAVVLGVAARQGEQIQDLPPKSGLVEIGDTPAAGLFEMAATTPLAPPLGDAAAGIAGINVAPGAHSGTIRQIPMLWRGPSGPLPSLSLEALRLAVGETTYFVEGIPDLAGAVQSIGVGPMQVPTDPNGQLWLRYRHNDPALYVPIRDVLFGEEEAALRAALEGHIVFVGTSAAGLLDIRTTALGEPVPGVSIHAQAVEQILLGDFLLRSDFIAGIELLIFVALGLIVTLVMTRSGARLSLFSGMLPAVLVVGASWYAFREHGILFDATFPLVGGAVNFMALMGYQFLVVDRDKRMIRRSFSHYVAPEVLGEIESSGHQLELGGVTREVTVLFSDIRDFTPLSERLPAQELVALLNELFTAQGSEILDRHGTIDKFIGDSIMAFWNAPLDVPDHSLRAAEATLAMRSRLDRFNRKLAESGRSPVGMAVGCAVGDVCVGNIGSQQRFNYTVIGDAVNMAARIEASCRRLEYDIAVSEEIAQQIGERLALLPAGALALKGITARNEVFLVVGDRRLAESDTFAALAQAHDNLVSALRRGEPLDERLLAHCRAISADVEPGLPGFYANLPGRLEDFAPG